MSDTKTLTFAFMEPPFESERTVTFFRLLDAALDRGAGVRVFAYEGAVAGAARRTCGVTPARPITL